MPTDELVFTPDDARRLLQRAAETIEVPPVSPVSPAPAPPRGRLPRFVPILAAAAAVAMIATGGLVWRALTTETPPPAETRLGEATMPSVFGYSRDDAVQLLEGLGLEVTVREQSGCGEPGRAIGTVPGIGLAADERVTLKVSGPVAANVDCAADAELPLSWALIDFATGRGDASEVPFADTLEVVGADEPVDLTATQAADPESWGPDSPLGLLAAATRQTRLGETGEEEAPRMTNSIGFPGESRCLPVSLPVLDETREPVSILVGYDDGPCLATLDLYFSGPPVGVLPGSQIDTIVGSGTELADDPSDRYLPGGDGPGVVRVPAVSGLRLSEARSNLTAAGFAVHVERLATCADPRGVIDQSPRAGTERNPGSTVTIVTEVPRATDRC